MSRWPEIDWPAFGAAVDDALKDCSAEGFSAREVGYRHGIGVSALSRARNGVHVAAGNFIAICQLFGLRPAWFLLNAPLPLPDDVRSRLSAGDVSRPTLTETSSATSGEAK